MRPMDYSIIPKGLGAGYEVGAVYRTVVFMCPKQRIQQIMYTPGVAFKGHAC